MNTFANAVVNQEARTTNGMKARASTGKAAVNLFFQIGASRGKDITPAFAAAYAEDKDLALRIALWTRDARGGAGERQLFRDILNYLETRDPAMASRLLNRVPELGRYDDLLVVKTPELKKQAFTMLGDALRASNGLAAKWTPRKGPLAREIREFYGMSPKQYRKSLVALTKVVETQMCAKDWDNINFNHVPSVAAARYKKAFNRNTTKFAEYVASLVKGDPAAKVNAGAVYPYDVIKGVGSYGWGLRMDKTERDHIIAQWAALPDYVGDASILPIVDVSGSMGCPAGRNGKVTCMDVSVSLGLYLAEKNRGKFKDTFLTFSGTPQLLHLKGTVLDKLDQMVKSQWAMNTDLVAAMSKVLEVAVKGRVPQEEMPGMLLILSDMQFDQCVTHDDTAMEMIERKFEAAGYQVPKVVFWNLNAHDNVPVAAHKTGAALVSGFSPAIMTSLLAADMEQFTPEGIMRQAVMVPRYDY